MTNDLYLLDTELIKQNAERLMMAYEGVGGFQDALLAMLNDLAKTAPPELDDALAEVLRDRFLDCEITRTRILRRDILRIVGDVLGEVNETGRVPALMWPLDQKVTITKPEVSAEARAKISAGLLGNRNNSKAGAV